MTDFTLVDPRGWEYDLHSVYSAYIGYFQVNCVPWYDRSWGHLFSSFEQFLAFSWPCIIVTDAWTGRAHIVTRLTSIGAFLRMIKTRFGETLLQAPNILQVTPFETATRHLRNISDYASYKKLHSTLPAAVLSALKARIRAGEPKAIRELWEKKDKTFLAIDFEWSERNAKSCLEWGYAAVRCGHLEALSHWPPVPDKNYRKGHYIVGEYVDRVVNKHCPTHPWHYAFGDSQVIPKAILPQVIQAVISSLASPDSETTANSLVLVAHGISGVLSRLDEMKIKIPHNILVLDTSSYERSLHSTGARGFMIDPKTNKPRVHGTTLSLGDMLRSLSALPTNSTPTPEEQHPSPLAQPLPLSIPPVQSAMSIPSLALPLPSLTPPSPPLAPQPLSQPQPPAPLVLPNVKPHNSGNDAFMTLFALQMLLEPSTTQVPSIKRGWIGRPYSGGFAGPMLTGDGLGLGGGGMGMGMGGGIGVPTVFSGFMAVPPPQSPAMMASPAMMTSPAMASASVYDLSGEFEQMQMQMSRSRSRSPGPYLATAPSPRVSSAWMVGAVGKR